MAATYPGGVKSFTPKVDDVDDVMAVDVNEAYEEIIAVETDLIAKVDQNVKSGASPTLSGANFTGVGVNYTDTIPYTSWTGESAPFTKVVSVAGILAADTPIIDIVPTGTYATDVIITENWGLIYRITTATDEITVYANEVPSADIPIILKVVR